MVNVNLLLEFFFKDNYRVCFVVVRKITINSLFSHRLLNFPSSEITSLLQRDQMSFVLLILLSGDITQELLR